MSTIEWNSSSPAVFYFLPRTVSRHQPLIMRSQGELKEAAREQWSRSGTSFAFVEGHQTDGRSFVLLCFRSSDERLIMEKSISRRRKCVSWLSRVLLSLSLSDGH